MKNVKWIVKKTNYAISKRCVNKVFDGYPLIHHIIMSYPKDRAYIKEEKKASKLLECLGALLDNGANVDILDVRGNTPLFSAVQDGVFDIRLYKMLLVCGADPNFVATTGLNAFEEAKQNKLSRDVISLLGKITKKVRPTSNNAKELFQKELSKLNPDIKFLNSLVSSKLFTPKRLRFIVPHGYETLFKNGFWIRTMSFNANVDREIKILKKRKKLSDIQLAKQGHRENYTNDRLYTKYQNSCYVKLNITRVM